MLQFLNQSFTRGIAATVIALATMTAQADVSSYPYTPTYNALAGDGWQGYSNNSNQAVITIGYSSSQNIKVERKTGSPRSRVFSPALEMKAGCRYTISFTAAAINPNAAMTLTPYITSEVVKSLLTADGVSDMLLATGETVATTNTTKKTVELTYTPEENSTVYLMVDVTTDASKSRTMYMSDFSVTELLLESKPEPVEDLTLTVVDNDARKIKLSWINPTHNLTGEPADIASIKIRRNGELIATLTEPLMLQPGAEASFEDTPAVSGEYEYTVTVTGADGKESAPVSVQSPYVGRPAALTVPHTFDFSNTTMNAFWTVDTKTDANGWNFASSMLQCTRDGYRPTDSTAATPDIELSDDKAYALTYTAQCTTKANTFAYSVALKGTGDEPWESVLAGETDFEPAANNRDESFRLIFTPAQSGVASIVFKSVMDKLSSTYYSNTFKITSMSIEEIPVVPEAATDLTAQAAPDGELKAELAWVNPSVTETGLPTGAITATIFRDGTEIATIDVTPGAAGQFTDTAELGLTPGYHTYSVVINNANGHTDADAPEATTGYTGGAVTLPYTSDFDTDAHLYLPVKSDPEATGATFQLVNNRFTVKTNPKTPAAALIAPLFELEPGHVYEITTDTYTSSYYELPFEIALAPRDAADDYSNIIGAGQIKGTSTSSARFAVETGGEYFPVILLRPATSGYSEYEYSITGLTFSEVPVVPAAVADLAARSNFNEGYVKITWTMPATSPEGVALTGNLTGHLYRGTEIAEDAEPAYTVEAEPGEECSWEDTEAAAGLNTYTLVISMPDYEAEALTVTSDYYAHATELPYAGDFATEEGRQAWSFIDASSSYYQGTTFEFNDNNEIYLLDGTSATSSNSRMNDWVVSPLFQMEPGVTYTLVLEAKGPSSGSSYYMPGFEAYIGATPDADGLKNGIKITGQYATKLTTEFEEYSFSFGLDGPVSGAARADAGDTEETPALTENRFIGINFGLGSYCYPEVTVKAIKVDSDKTPTGVTDADIDATAAIFVAGKSVYAEGADISIFNLNGACVASGFGSIDASSLPAGIYIVSATTNHAKKTIKICLK